MKISVIVPVYNKEKYLERCVKSLLSQTYENIEIVLVNDGSTDNSGILCDKLKSEDTRIRVIHKENGGLSSARNAGIKVATGDYVGFVDSDDSVDENMYESLLNSAKKYDADIALCGSKVIGGKMFQTDGLAATYHTFEKETVFETKDDIKKLALGILGAPLEVFEDSEYGTSVCKNIYKTSLIKEHNLEFLSERIYGSEDLLFMIDFVLCAKKAVGVPGAFYNYYFISNSLSNTRKADGFERIVLLNETICKRLSEKMPYDQYIFSADRHLLSSARAMTIQEVIYAQNNPDEKKYLKPRLRDICGHQNVRNAFKRFPYRKLSLMQAIFAFSLKYRLVGLQILLVKLRSKI